MALEAARAVGACGAARAARAMGAVEAVGAMGFCVHQALFVGLYVLCEDCWAT